MSNKLVSIITPCYNGEKVVSRYLDSVLNQTYKNIELIFVNDGSIDNTEGIVLSYEYKFKNEGMKLIYIYQENKGLGGAIDTGLKHFKGDFLCWADADDFFHPQSVEKKVEFLEKYKEYGCVTTNANVYNEDDLSTVIYKITDKFKHHEDEYQFEHHLKSESIFCCGCHMVRSEVFLDVNPKREIYPARRGQNWQMLLPVYYKYKRGFLDEPLYNYIIYKNSMSTGDDSKEKKIKRCNEHLDIVKNTLDSISMTDKDRKMYFNMFYKKYIVDRFDISMQYKDIKSGIRQYMLMRKYNVLRKYDTKSLIKVAINRVIKI
ncbi:MULTISPECIES: glycosyltransferase family A protein [unclassified Romboutsia]|uniref:glycosyltransferase family A protein n=1 Tax=unclassified Romboutsia TaxID=2626894 RepID=UPI0008222154|nr:MULTISPECIES: glycosyltransferase family A protein [unclassified Romboutsia]SCH20007.1 Chondroitin polymerase [uncultured Clostridium sp.]